MIAEDAFKGSVACRQTARLGEGPTYDPATDTAYWFDILDRKLFEHERGAGYPKERAAIMAKNRGILKDLKAASCKDMLTVLKSVDQDLLKAAVSGEKFQELFFTSCQDDAIAAHIKSVLA